MFIYGITHIDVLALSMNRMFTNLISLIVVVALLIWGFASGHPFLALGGLALFLIPEFVAYHVHRCLFSRLLQKNGLKLVSFRQINGFRHYEDQPWWKWTEGYEGSVAFKSGRTVECFFSVGGALFAMIHPEMSYELIDDESDACLEV